MYADILVFCSLSRWSRIFVCVCGVCVWVCSIHPSKYPCMHPYMHSCVNACIHASTQASSGERFVHQSLHSSIQLPVSVSFLVFFEFIFVRDVACLLVSRPSSLRSRFSLCREAVSMAVIHQSIGQSVCE